MLCVEVHGVLSVGMVVGSVTKPRDDPEGRIAITCNSYDRDRSCASFCKRRRRPSRRPDRIATVRFPPGRGQDAVSRSTVCLLPTRLSKRSRSVLCFENLSIYGIFYTNLGM